MRRADRCEISIHKFQMSTSIVSCLYWYYRCLWYFTTEKKLLDDCPYFKDDLHAQVHVYSIALIRELWSKPHYRSGTFQHDMVKNLRNVAIPGTGIALSVFCHYQWTVWIFILVIYPLIALICAVRQSSTTLSIAFYQHLLNPTDWFSYWRLNCCLASWHSLKTSDEGYAMENKWHFLRQAKDQNVPVTPWLETPAEIVVKDKNEEGGMGIHFFKNAAGETGGGQWIIQPKMYNATIIAKLLPENAPLSTFRIMTARLKGNYKALSCVFRAGRSGAETDHDSLMFDVDMDTGRIGFGTTTTHWYKVGLQHIWTTPWQIGHEFTMHPDTGVNISGTQIPNAQEMVQLVESAHARLLPGVPIVGWDVALTTDGLVLLEVNLSCNFFRGSFDKNVYIEFVYDHFKKLEDFEKKL